MAYMVGRGTVADYAAYKKEFEATAPLRRANGSRGSMIFQSVNDPHEIVVVIDWESAEMGKRFIESPDVAPRIRQSFVNDQYEVYKGPDLLDA